MGKHTPGPWTCTRSYRVDPDYGRIPLIEPLNGENPVAEITSDYVDEVMWANARLIAAAPEMNEEMVRYLPILERAEADPEVWARLTEGTGIATLNGYRAAIAKATGETPCA